MKNIVIPVYLSILCSLILFSCKRDKLSERKEKIQITNLVKEFLLKYDKPRNGTITFQHQDAAWLKHEPINIMISGSSYINKNPEVTTSSRGYTINKTLIPFNGDYKAPGFLIQSFGNSSDRIAFLKNIWGTKVKIGFTNSGSSILNSSFRTTTDEGFYIPEQIEMEANFVDNFQISENINNTISWNPDPQNPINSIFICVTYEGTLSNETNPSFSADNTVQVFLEVPDNGSYTLTPDLLDMLPVDARAAITIARANYEMIVDPTTGEEVLVQAITYSTSGPIGITY